MQRVTADAADPVAAADGLLAYVPEAAEYVPCPAPLFRALLERARRSTPADVHPAGKDWTLEEIEVAFPVAAGRPRSRTSATKLVTDGFFGVPNAPGGPRKRGNRWIVPDAVVRAKLAAEGDSATPATSIPTPDVPAASPAPQRAAGLTPISDGLRRGSR